MYLKKIDLNINVFFLSLILISFSEIYSIKWIPLSKIKIEEKESKDGNFNLKIKGTLDSPTYEDKNFELALNILNNDTIISTKKITCVIPETNTVSFGILIQANCKIDLLNFQNIMNGIEVKEILSNYEGMEIIDTNNVIIGQKIQPIEINYIPEIEFIIDDIKFFKCEGNNYEFKLIGEFKNGLNNINNVNFHLTLFEKLPIKSKCNYNNENYEVICSAPIIQYISKKEFNEQIIIDEKFHRYDDNKLLKISINKFNKYKYIKLNNLSCLNNGDEINKVNKIIFNNNTTNEVNNDLQKNIKNYTINSTNNTINYVDIKSNQFGKNDTNNKTLNFTKIKEENQNNYTESSKISNNNTNSNYSENNNQTNETFNNNENEINQKNISAKSIEINNISTFENTTKEIMNNNSQKIDNITNDENSDNQTPINENQLNTDNNKNNTKNVINNENQNVNNENNINDNNYSDKMKRNNDYDENEPKVNEQEKEKEENIEKNEEKEKLGYDIIEQERIENEEAEKEKLEQEKLEKEKLEQENNEKEKLEQEKLEKEKLEKQKIQQEKLKQEQLEKEKLEQEKLQKEKLEKEKLEREKLEKEKLQKEKLEKEKLQQEKLKQEQIEKEKLEQEKLRQEKLEKEKLEQERIKKEKEEKEKLEKDKQKIIKEEHKFENLHIKLIHLQLRYSKNKLSYLFYSLTPIPLYHSIYARFKIIKSRNFLGNTETEDKYLQLKNSIEINANSENIITEYITELDCENCKAIILNQDSIQGATVYGIPEGDSLRDAINIKNDENSNLINSNNFNSPLLYTTEKIENNNCLIKLNGKFFNSISIFKGEVKVILLNMVEFNKYENEDLILSCKLEKKIFICPIEKNMKNFLYKVKPIIIDKEKNIIIDNTMMNRMSLVSCSKPKFDNYEKSNENPTIKKLKKFAIGSVVLVIMIFICMKCCNSFCGEEDELPVSSNRVSYRDYYSETKGLVNRNRF